MKKTLPLVLAFILGAFAFWALGHIASFLPNWRTIQVIKTTDRSHVAELRRLYRYIDVNFEIILDGRKIYRSPDFAPSYDRPFREWITWDESGQNIALIVADQVLFAYNLSSQTAIPKEKFSSLVIPRYTLGDLRYEGDH